MKTLVTLLVLGAAVSLGARDAPGATLYVSPAGNDAWTGENPDPQGGTATGPKATLAAALTAARQLRARGGAGTAPLEIVLRGGTYQLAATVTLTPADSGTEQSPLVIRAQTGEVPVLSGGVRLAGGSLSGEKWVFDSPPALQGAAFSQLYVNGARRRRVRMPKTGYYYIASPKDHDVPRTPDEFYFYPGDISAAANPTEMVVKAFAAWNMFTIQVASVDPAQNLVVFNTPMPGRPRMPLDRKVWYVVENPPDAPLDPGEWHLDSQSRQVTYNPRGGEDLASAEVVAPHLDRLLTIQGRSIVLQGSRIYDKVVQNVRLQNLTFAYTDWLLPPKGFRGTQGASLTGGAVEVAGAQNVSFVGCIFRETGACGLIIGAAVHSFAVQDSTFGDVGASGIRIGSFIERDLTYPAQWTDHGIIRNNLVTGFGQVHPDACGIMAGFAGALDISNNEVTDGYYTGISVGWNFAYGVYAARDNTIRQNRISHLGQQVMSDMGGIYTLGEQPGTQIVGNVISDVQSARYGAWGIYLDEGSGSMLVANNLAYNLGSAAVHIHWGRDLDIEKNVLALGRDCVFENTNDGKTGHYTLRSNVLLTAGAPFIGKKGILPGTDISNNDYVLVGGTAAAARFPGGTDISGWRLREIDAAVDDPGFGNPAGGDFTPTTPGPLEARGIDLQMLDGAGLITKERPAFVHVTWWDPAPAPQPTPPAVKGP